MSPLAVIPAFADAATQSVAAVPARIETHAGQPFSVQLRNDVIAAPADAHFSGLGVRVHFDSRRLRFVGFANVLAVGKLAEDPAPAEDRKDVDHDPSTDRFVQVARVDVQANWPGASRSPLNLLEARFVATPGPAAIFVRVSSSGTAPGAQFTATPAEVTIRQSRHLCARPDRLRLVAFRATL